ncbi:MAG: hypothetical protein H0U56_09440 [Methylibium sp.]|nr:hypothetical protein [Methylibium sp.]
MSTSTAEVRRRSSTVGRSADGAADNNSLPEGQQLTLSLLSASIDSVGDSATRKSLTALQNDAQSSGGNLTHLERELIHRLTQAVLSGGKSGAAGAQTAQVIDAVSDVAKTSPSGELTEVQRSVVFALLDAIGSGKCGEKDVKAILDEFRKLSTDADGFTEQDAVTLRNLIEQMTDKAQPDAAAVAKDEPQKGKGGKGADGDGTGKAPKEDLPSANGAAAAGDPVAPAGPGDDVAGATGKAPKEDAPAAIGPAAAVDAIAGSEPAGAKGVQALRAADAAQGNWLTYAAEEAIGATLTSAQASDPVFMSAFAAKLNADKSQAVNNETPKPAQVQEKQEAIEAARRYAEQCSELGMTQEDAVAFASRLSTKEISDPDFMAALAARLEQTPEDKDGAYQFASMMMNHGIPSECIDYYATHLTPKEAADAPFIASLANYSHPLAGQPHDPAGALAKARSFDDRSAAATATAMSTAGESGAWALASTEAGQGD